MSDYLKKCVANGAAWLDLNVVDWYNKVNLENLLLYHCDRCIIGQIFGLQYEEGSIAWRKYHNIIAQYELNPKEMGFDSPIKPINEKLEKDYEASWDILAYLWKEEILERRKKYEESVDRESSDSQTAWRQPILS